MPSRKKSDSPTIDSDLTFEDALARLEEIVESMEGEQLPLEDLVAQYETGSTLLKHCAGVLANAHKRIDLITLSNNGEQPATFQQTPANQQGVPDDDNDISLF